MAAVTEWLVPALLGLIVLLLLGLLLRRGDERLARELRAELHDSAREARQELGGNLSLFQQALLAQGGDLARTQNEQMDSFRVQLAAMQQQVSDALQAATHALAQQGQTARDAQDAALRRLADSLGTQLAALSQANERRLGALQEGNERKLEQMRATVDEKLHATLEQRLSESFRQVAERLEQVHKGLGEMQLLARDVGALNRVLTNVKTRGVFGEVQLAALLEQVFTPEQYATNVATVPGSAERVEFAIRLPGQRGDRAPLWLPIDAKFPREDYERLLDAQERADAAALEACSRAIESRLRLEAKTVRAKYLAPSYTTDFAILFVPTEGLYAEALRRPGLVEALQREHKVMLAGPTTLLATLSSLQMGFRTLALEQRSAEVWQVLGAVKTEFGKFGEVLKKTREKLNQAADTISAAETRTRQMGRALKSVEALPQAQVQQLLPQVSGNGVGNDAGDDDAAPAAAAAGVVAAKQGV
ncbi:MAG TPA: DNA recombination protein RmuC [Rubrivivax sp.]|nr:DNA recombination protein RmuC [Rubrivivax sp.]